MAGKEKGVEQSQKGAWYTLAGHCPRPLTLFPEAVLCRCPLIAASVTGSLDIIISYLGTSPQKSQKPTRNPGVFTSARSPAGLFWTAVKSKVMLMM
jgi:hypothetical protein